jgi:TPR repeat protein
MFVSQKVITTMSQLVLRLGDRSFSIPKKFVIVNSDLFDLHPELHDDPLYDVESEVDAPVFQTFLDFIRTQDESTVTTENWRPLLTLAGEFGVSCLQEICSAIDTAEANEHLLAQVSALCESVSQENESYEAMARDFGRFLSEFVSAMGKKTEQRIELLESEVSRVVRALKGEQLYRQGQELLCEKGPNEKNVSAGLMRLKEAAGLGHLDSALACGLHLEAGRICSQSLGEAVDYFRLSADGGNALGAVKYGGYLQKGIGTEKNEAAAARYFKLSVDQGNSQAQCAFGCCLQKGNGTAKNEAEAAKYFKLSADQGNSDGQRRYGLCLESGIGTGKNLAGAAKYYQLSAEQGNNHAQFNYGRCLELGIGIGKNGAEAAKYYKLSADQGNSDAQFEYGRCLEMGKGIVINLAEAAKYYKLSADQGNPMGHAFYSQLLSKQ